MKLQGHHEADGKQMHGEKGEEANSYKCNSAAGDGKSEGSVRKLNIPCHRTQPICVCVCEFSEFSPTSQNRNDDGEEENRVFRSG